MAERHAIKSRRFPEYRSWHSMMCRCYRRADIGYHRYGGRGITVCERWHTYANFLADMGSRPSLRHSIDRADIDGNYCPENCRWVTKKEQSRNRCNNRLVTFRGETLPLCVWAERRGMSWETLKGRLKAGWSIEKTLTTPKGPYRKRS